MRRILVVDDARDFADTTETLLQLLGYTTRTAYDGQQAVEAAMEERPDVVLLDLNMPVLDGYAAARAIRNRYGSPPLLVAVSALVGSDFEARLRECGFDHYVTKPADITKLLSIVEGRPGWELI